MKNIVICGFGNIAHAIVANNKRQDISLTILSLTANKSGPVRVENIRTGDFGEAYLEVDPAKCLPSADYLIFCVPSHVRAKLLREISSFINPKTILGAFPGVSGFNDEVVDILPENKSYFASQRVPFISRVLESGKVDSLKKDELYIAISPFANENIIEDIDCLLSISVKKIKSFDLINLTNSNPLLHTARIYDFLKNNEPPFLIDIDEKFYENWNDNASDILVQMDFEFQLLMKKLGHDTKNILEHYEVGSIKELTSKIKNIPAFKGIKFPMKEANGSFLVDFSSRYFLEDFNLGLVYTLKRANDLNIDAPTIRKVLNFYKNIVGC